MPAAHTPEAGAAPASRATGQQLTTPAEVLQILHALRDADSPIQLMPTQADVGSGVSGTLWLVDASNGQLSFSVGGPDALLIALLRAGRACVHAELDGVGIDFEVSQLQRAPRAQGSGTSVRTALPTHIQRHQRRDSFRVRNTLRAGPTVRIDLPREVREAREALILRVADLSLGGCSLFWPQGPTPPQAGATLRKVTVELGPGNGFVADLILRGVHGGDAASTPGETRLRCEWERFDGGAQRALQRYLDEAQRRQRAKALA